MEIKIEKEYSEQKESLTLYYPHSHQHSRAALDPGCAAKNKICSCRYIWLNRVLCKYVYEHF